MEVGRKVSRPLRFATGRLLVLWNPQGARACDREAGTMGTIESQTTSSNCPVKAGTSELGTLQLKGGESRLDPLIRNNPFPFYRALRKQQPVY